MSKIILKIRKSQITKKLLNAVFGHNDQKPFIDPAFKIEDPTVTRLEQIAWEAYIDSRKKSDDN